MFDPYLDPVGYPTIGYGSRFDIAGSLVTMQTPAISKLEAEILLKRSLLKYENGVLSALKINVNQNKFDALVSFCYNVGNIKYLASKINAGTISSNDFMKFRFARDQKTGQLVELVGLINRRAREAALYFD